MKKGAIKQCLICNNDFYVSRCHLNAKYCSYKCYWLTLKDKLPISNSGFKKGQKGARFIGRWKNKAGYVFIYKPNHPYREHHKCVREHRLVVEEILSRYLLPKEQIHHINGIKNDNRVENLYYFSSNSLHSKYHYLLNANLINPVTKTNLFDIKSQLVA